MVSPVVVRIQVDTLVHEKVEIDELRELVGQLGESIN